MIDVRILGSGSSGNAYIVSNGDTTLLLECGLSIKTLQVATQYRITDIDACLVSHEHGDHSKAAKHLAKFGLDIYMSAGTKEVIDANEHRFKVFQTSAPLRYKPFTIRSFHVAPFRAIHDAKEPIGFRITDTSSRETLTFLTDSVYCPYRFNGSTIFMVEINYIKEIIDKNTEEESMNVGRRNRTVESHMSLETAVDFLKSSGAEWSRAIYAMHLSDLNSDEERIYRRLREEFRKPEIIIC